MGDPRRQGGVMILIPVAALRRRLDELVEVVS